MIRGTKIDVRLSFKERRALVQFAKPVGKRDYTHLHGNSIHALERKGLIYCDGRRPGRHLTPAGHAELAAVPNIFDDLFDRKKTSMPATTTKATTTKTVQQKAAAAKRLAELTDVEIEAHPLLDPEQQHLCKTFRNIARKKQERFTMLEFAEISLRASGNDYASATNQGGRKAARLDALHRRAAILYAYEALKAGPKIVTETIDERGTLRDLELLVSHGRV